MNAWLKRLVAVLAVAALGLASPASVAAQDVNDEPANDNDNAVNDVTAADAVNDVLPDAGVEPDRPRGLNEGDWSLAFGTNVVHDVYSRAENMTTFNLDVRVAYNVLDNLRIGALTELMIIDVDNTALRYQFAGRATFHIDEIDPELRFVPYFGGGAGLTVLDMSSGMDEFGPSLHAVAGLEYHIRGDGVFRNTSVFAEYSPELIFYGGSLGTTYRGRFIMGLGIHW